MSTEQAAEAEAAPETASEVAPDAAPEAEAAPEATPEQAMPFEVVLASASPRRRELLEQAGVKFSV
ncbi:MAG: Maf family protein, partial [Eggerthellaceae bacterium]|nr:Maf family protein [Eggerthellaceae bacterium]